MGARSQGGTLRGRQFTAGAGFGGAQFPGHSLFHERPVPCGPSGECPEFTRSGDSGTLSRREANSGTPSSTGETTIQSDRWHRRPKQGTVWPKAGMAEPDREPDNGEDPTFRYLARVEDVNTPDT